MRRRILAAILATTALAVMLYALPLSVMIVRNSDDRTQLLLQASAVTAAREVPYDFASDVDDVELPTGGSISYAVYDVGGQRLAGTGPDSADPAVTQALANHVSYTERDKELVTAIPLFDQEEVIGALRAAEPTSVSDAQSRAALAAVVAVGIAVLVTAGIVASALASRLASPIQQLSRAAGQIGNGDTEVRVPRLAVPELDEVGRALGDTSARIQQLLARERSFSADASHQLRTPLTGIRANIETELDYPRPDREQVLRETLVDVDRLEATITELLALARGREQPSRVDVGAVLSDLEPVWAVRLARIHRQLVVERPGLIAPARGNAVALRHALDVLLDNATVHGAGTVEVSVQVRADVVRLTVTDEGEGFPAGFPGGSAAEGHGLGIPLATRLVEGMAGRLSVTDPGPHPRISIVLARADDSSREATDSP